MSDERKHRFFKTAFVHGLILTVGIVIGRKIEKDVNHQ